jgi:hypothetical protein
MCENVGASTSRNPKGLHGLYRDNFTFTRVNGQAANDLHGYRRLYGYKRLCREERVQSSSLSLVIRQWVVIRKRVQLWSVYQRTTEAEKVTDS